MTGPVIARTQRVATALDVLTGFPPSVLGAYLDDLDDAAETLENIGDHIAEQAVEQAVDQTAAAS